MTLPAANKEANNDVALRPVPNGRVVVDAIGRTVGFIAPRKGAGAFVAAPDVLALETQSHAMNCDPYNSLGRVCAEMIYKRLR